MTIHATETPVSIPVIRKKQRELRGKLEEELLRPVGQVLLDFYAPATAVSNEAISSTQRLFAILRWPDLEVIAEPLSPQVPGRRGQIYPSGLLLALATWSLELGSRDEMEALLREGTLWLAIQTLWLERTGMALASNPPRANHVDVFYARARQLSREGQGLALALPIFRARSLELVRSLGGLDAHAPFDPLSNSWSNTIIGDGTYIRPNSGVKEVLTGISADGQAEFEYLGSRSGRGGKSTQGPRVQRVLTSAHEDGKEATATGINFVHLIWRSNKVRERVVLDISSAIGSEAATALPMVVRLCQESDGGVHSVIWDMALNEKAEKITPKTGAVLITKKSGKAGKVVNRPTKPNLVHSFAVPLATWRKQVTVTPEWKRLTAGDRMKSEEHFLDKLWRESAQSRTGQAGITVRERGNGLQIRSSEISAISSIDCDTQTLPCSHRLAWEDGTLVEVQEGGATFLRKQVAMRTGITRTQDSEGLWMISATWSLACGENSWNATAHWSSGAVPEERYIENIMTGWSGDVISELDGEVFHKVHGIRNDVESYHQWLMRRFKFDRANTLDANDQLLDLLAIAVGNNAVASALDAGTVKGMRNGPRPLVRSRQSCGAKDIESI